MKNYCIKILAVTLLLQLALSVQINGESNIFDYKGLINGLLSNTNITLNETTSEPAKINEFYYYYFPVYWIVVISFSGLIFIIAIAYAIVRCCQQATVVSYNPVPASIVVSDPYPYSNVQVHVKLNLIF